MSTTSAEPKQRRYGPIDVTSDEIALFAEGINDDAPGAVANPFFVAKILIPGSARVLFAGDADIDVQRIVHAGIEMNFHRPIADGDALSCRSWLISLDNKESGKLVSIGVTIADEAGNTVVDGITRYFSRGKARGSGAKAAPEPWLQGDVTSISVPTKENQSLLYAEGSGDKFPIHTDDSFAKMVGLPGVIMHGMCTLALSVNALVSEVLAGDYASVATVECRFAKTVLPGDLLTVNTARHGDDHRFETVKSDGKTAISEGRVTVRS